MKELFWFIGGLILFYLGYLFVLRTMKPMKEGFSQTPIIEVSRAIAGEHGIQSIVKKYVSSSNSSEMTQQLDALLSDIQSASTMIQNAQTKCIGGECALNKIEIQTILPAVQQMVIDLQKWMASVSNVVSMEDQQLLQSNIDIIIGYEYLLSTYGPDSDPHSTPGSTPSITSPVPSSTPGITSPVPTSTLSSTSSPSSY